MKYKAQISCLIKAILAGICVSVGCNVYLSSDNKYIGSILFAVGLITILLFDFNLYTGKVGYIINNGLSFIKVVTIILIGNIIGCICIGIIFPSELATVLCESKVQIPLTDVLYKSIMCGFMMFIAVETYKIYHTFIPVILCVATFIISGYEHSIANITYFIMGRMLTLKSLFFITIVIIGNAIGTMIIPICNKITTTLQNE